jgi:nicotinate (nicotinamide) nucleotide adenylyltransferase
MRIGILGGSFNPPHFGHLALARAALETGEVECVLFIPAATPPHKVIPSGTNPEMRYEMTLLLAKEDAHMAVDPLELERTGPSYTIDTLHELAGQNPGNTYRLIIGSDMALMFSKWKDYREILRLAPPLIAERPDALLRRTQSPTEMFRDLDSRDAEVLFAGLFPMEPVPINSTLIRERIQAGAEDEEMLRYLPATVLAYIKKHGLYEDEIVKKVEEKK